MKAIQTLSKRYRYSLILLKELVRTDFILRYEGSALGYIWSLLRPLFMFVILYFIFVYFLRIGAGIPHWPVALLLGIVMWNFFAEVTNIGVKSIVAQGDVIRKINFPKYIIVLSATISALINLSINMIVIAIFVVLNHVPLTLTMFLIPAYILELFIFAMGCAFVLSTIYVKLRDANFIWDIIMQGLTYASAVIFPISRISDKSALATKIVLLNPIAQTIEDARHSLIPSVLKPAHSYYGHVEYILIPMFIVVLVTAFGAWYFKKRSIYFAEDI